MLDWKPQTSKMESFATVVSELQPLRIAAKLSILDTGGGLGYILERLVRSKPSLKNNTTQCIF